MCNHPLPFAVLETRTDEAEAAASAPFAERLLTIANNATTGLMISIGHRCGLFEALADNVPLTSVELADKSRLNERYVREWASALASAGILEYDRTSQRFRLPSEHSDFLGRSASQGNMAAMFQFIAVLGNVESRIVDCFRTGGGVPYQAFDRFHEVMAEESAQTVVEALEPAIIPLVPGLKSQLERGIAVADIGCGSGQALNRLAALYPKSRFIGYDLCEDAIRAANRESTAAGLDNVRFIVADATDLPGQGLFDLIFTFDAVHDQAKPASVLRNIRRLLTQDGIYLMQDIDSASDLADNLDRPLAPFIYAISCMHCMTVSLAQNGEGLGAAWGEELATAMLTDAGFRSIETHRLEHDIMNLYYVCR